MAQPQQQTIRVNSSKNPNPWKNSKANIPSAKIPSPNKTAESHLNDNEQWPDLRKGLEMNTDNVPQKVIVPINGSAKQLSTSGSTPSVKYKNDLDQSLSKKMANVSIEETKENRENRENNNNNNVNSTNTNEVKKNPQTLNSQISDSQQDNANANANVNANVNAHSSVTPSNNNNEDNKNNKNDNKKNNESNNNTKATSNSSSVSSDSKVTTPRNNESNNNNNNNNYKNHSKYDSHRSGGYYNNNHYQNRRNYGRQNRRGRGRYNNNHNHNRYHNNHNNNNNNNNNNNTNYDDNMSSSNSGGKMQKDHDYHHSNNNKKRHYRGRGRGNNRYYNNNNNRYYNNHQNHNKNYQNNYNNNNNHNYNQNNMNNMNNNNQNGNNNNYNNNNNYYYNQNQNHFWNAPMNGSGPPIIATPLPAMPYIAQQPMYPGNNNMNNNNLQMQSPRSLTEDSANNDSKEEQKSDSNTTTSSNSNFAYLNPMNNNVMNNAMFMMNQTNLLLQQCDVPPNIHLALNQSLVPPPMNEERNIPSGPFYCLKVSCVAIGTNAEDRAVAHIALVDFNLSMVCNVFVRPKSKVISLIEPLTGLSHDIIDKYGLSLEEAIKIIRASLPKNSVIIGQNVIMDLGWLNLKRGMDYSEFIDLRDLWRSWSPYYSSYTHYSLAHQSKCVLGQDMRQHSAAMDANQSMKLFHFYLWCRFTQNGTLLNSKINSLMQTRPAPSFAKMHPVYQGVQMKPKKHYKGVPYITNKPMQITNTNTNTNTNDKVNEKVNKKINIGGDNSNNTCPPNDDK